MSKRIFALLCTIAVALFVNVNDKPVIGLEEYHEIIEKGKVVADICGEETLLFWQDFSNSDRTVLREMLGIEEGATP